MVRKMKNKLEGATWVVKCLSCCRRFFIETAHSQGGSGTALRIKPKSQPGVVT